MRDTEDPDASDDVLMARVADGNAAAFRMLLGRHSDRAFAVALRMVQSRADAEDIVQDAFFRVWSSARRWHPSGPRFSTWLHRVVLNLCLDLHRRRRHRRHDDLDAAAEVPDPRPGVETRLADRAQRRALAAAVRQLPDRQRTALALTYAGGLSNADVAEIMDISVGAVESLLVRARRDLRSRVGGGED
jgi:RNA polymerase sigma-70 factor (ECF subfamily)